MSHRFDSMPTLACGETPAAAATAFIAHRWPEDTVRLTDTTVYPDGLFRVRCYVDSTSIKIDGKEIPGGFVVIEWI